MNQHDRHCTFSITTFSIPKYVLNAQTMLRLHYHYITTKTKSAPTLPPCNHTTTNITTTKTPQSQHNHHYHTTTNVQTSIFLLCPFKDSGTFIVALRPTTTTAAKIHSRYPPPKKKGNKPRQDKKLSSPE